MGSLLNAFILFLTVFTVVAIGILSAYGSVLGLLRLLASQTAEPAGDKPILVPNRAHAAHAGGD